MKNKLIDAAVKTVLPSVIAVFMTMIATTQPAYYEAICGQQAILPGIY